MGFIASAAAPLPQLATIQQGDRPQGRWRGRSDDRALSKAAARSGGHRPPDDARQPPKSVIARPVRRLVVAIRSPCVSDVETHYHPRDADMPAGGLTFCSRRKEAKTRRRAVLPLIQTAKRGAPLLEIPERWGNQSTAVWRFVIGDIGVQYFVESWEKTYFLLTPAEFRSVFNDFSFVVSYKRVEKEYTVSEPEQIFRQYTVLYQLLSSGKQCVWSEDYDILGFSIGVTAHPENCCYSGTGRWKIPNFSEPCVELQAFCVRPFGNTPLSKGWEISQCPQNTIGIEMMFPRKITPNQKETQSFETLADHTTWEDICKRIKTIAPNLYIMHNGKKYNTRIRVSQEAKKDLQKFYSVQNLGICIL